MLAQEIMRFLLLRRGIYYNPRHVEMSLLMDGGICVTANLVNDPKPNGINLDVLYNSKTIEGFVEDFGFRSVAQLKTLKSDKLMELFYAGKADMVSLLEDYDKDMVSFRRKGDKLFLIEETEEEVKELEIVPPLETNEDFINYAREYAQMTG